MPAVISCKTAWLTLEAAERDLTQFISYVVAASRGAFPGCFVNTGEILRSTIMPDIEVLADIFCVDINLLDEPFVLALDDYHRVASPEVDSFVDIVLRRPPGNLHLVIVSRHDPGLSLQVFRASGALTEVRMQQLAFNEEESQRFIRKSLGTISEDAARKLHERVEGWPVGLRLAMLATSGLSSSTYFVDQLPADSYAVRDYLLGEVLAGQSTNLREYLLRTAYLDRFCEELCEAIMPEDVTGMSGGEFIRGIDQSGLFSVALDARQEWFRFHHLFQTMLQERAQTELGHQAILDVHRRASTWFEEHGYIEEAIRHAHLTGHALEAVSIIVRNRTDIMNREQWPRLMTWLKFPRLDVVASRPELLLMKARMLVATGENADLAQTLDRAESLLDTAVIDDILKGELRGSLASMRCYQFYVMSDGEGAVRAARQAIELLPPDGLAERGYAMILLGAGMQMTGDATGAKRTLYAALSEETATSESGVIYRTRVIVALGFLYWMNAELSALEANAETTEELALPIDHWQVLTCALHFKAAVHYHRNELSAVEGDLKALLDHKAIRNPDLHSHCLVILALSQQALGTPDKALRTSAMLHDLALRSHSTYLIDLAEAFTAELAMRQGRRAEALKWAAEYDPEPLVPMYAFFSSPICLAKILILSDSPENHERARTLLDQLEAYLTRIHNLRFLMETLALKAVLSERTGDGALALEQLGHAVTLAEPGGFIRVFVDLGPELFPLLNRLELKGDTLQYVGRILAAFQAEAAPKGMQRAAAETGVAIRDVAGMPEPLSPREKEVLALLGERLSNKEIGERLFIATATVKRHAQSIYEKLNVTGRREAVTKAQGLGLIVDPSSLSSIRTKV